MMLADVRRRRNAFPPMFRMRIAVRRPASIIVIITVAMLFLSNWLLVPSPARAQSTQILGGDAVDYECMFGTGQAQWLWNNSNIWGLGVYIGGVDSISYQDNNCPYQTSNVSSAALATDMSYGWGLAFIWVGHQDPGSGLANQYTSGSQATADGENDASAAANKMYNLGLGGTFGPIYADVEAFGGESNSTDLTLAQLYVNGWSYELDKVQIFDSGVYGSICGSAIDDYKYHSNVPDDIWPAWYNSATATTTMDLSNPGCSPGIPNSDWGQNQRIVQWAKNSPLKVGTNTYYVDYDCALGRVTSDFSYQVACQGKQSQY